MKIGEDKIQEIRDATDIVDVVSQYVTLKKRGKSFQGLCPFHHEKTPSFHVDPTKGFYHCFGCGEGGDVFSFLMKMENIGFMEALRESAKKANIEIPVSDEDQQQVQESELLYYANDMAAQFYEQCLHKTDAGKRALEYLSERGFSESAISAFHLGYAPNLWDGVQKAAERASVKVEHLAKAGLVILRQGGKGYYDRFRGRLIFPIQNISGRVVGFGGRIMKAAKDQPKYLNSPETAIYRKGQILYGLSQSKTAIRKRDKVVLCEGYTDLIRLYTEGFDFCVATSGTALTDSQARILARYTRNATLVFDGDSAGLQAAMRGAGILFKAGMRVHMIALPPAEDPDTYLKKYGRESFAQLLDQAVNVIDFQIARWQKANRLSSMESRLDCAQELLEIVDNIHEGLERTAMIKQVAEKLQLSEELLNRKMRREIDVIDFSRAKRTARDQAEESIIKILLHGSPEWGRRIFTFIGVDMFESSINKKIIKYFEINQRQKVDLSLKDVFNQFRDDEEISIIISEWAQLKEEDPLRYQDNYSQEALGAILFLKEKPLKDRIAGIIKRIKEEEKDVDILPLQNERLKLKKTIQNIHDETISQWKKMVEI